MGVDSLDDDFGPLMKDEVGIIAGRDFALALAPRTRLGRVGRQMLFNEGIHLYALCKL
jgi:hypothetical protein